jgi:hypothetical protein
MIILILGSGLLAASRRMGLWMKALRDGGFAASSG